MILYTYVIYSIILFSDRHCFHNRVQSQAWTNANGLVMYSAISRLILLKDSLPEAATVECAAKYECACMKRQVLQSGARPQRIRGKDSRALPVYTA